MIDHILGDLNLHDVIAKYYIEILGVDNVYYIALLDVWEYIGKAPKKPENIKLEHYTLVY